MKYIWLVTTVGWFVFMTYLSHQPGPETSNTSLWLAGLLGDIALDGFLRKLAHVVLFLVFSILLSITLRGFGADWKWALLVFLWAVVDEATKPLVVGRHFAWLDVGLNEIGVAIGVIATHLTAR